VADAGKNLSARDGRHFMRNDGKITKLPSWLINGYRATSSDRGDADLEDGARFTNTSRGPAAHRDWRQPVQFCREVNLHNRQAVSAAYDISDEAGFLQQTTVFLMDEPLSP
jgi:hypothetical protein